MKYSHSSIRWTLDLYALSSCIWLPVSKLWISVAFSITTDTNCAQMYWFSSCIWVRTCGIFFLCLVYITQDNIAQFTLWCMIMFFSECIAYFLHSFLYPFMTPHLIVLLCIVRTGKTTSNEIYTFLYVDFIFFNISFSMELRQMTHVIILHRSVGYEWQKTGHPAVLSMSCGNMEII